MATYKYLNGHINGVRPYFFMYNGQRYNAAYYNGHMVFGQTSEEHITKYTPFFVENITNSTETLNILRETNGQQPQEGASATTLTIEYSSDATNWATLGTTSDTALTRTLAAGERLYLRCQADKWGIYQRINFATYYDYHSIRGVSKVGGNIMSLLYGANFTGEETSFPNGGTRQFFRLFYNNRNLKNAHYLILPATTLAEDCYGSMFYGCTLLTAAPALPATTLAKDCYGMMFYGCTSLTAAPALPATTLAERCYYDMFNGCTSLTAAPALPATTLTQACYVTMFMGCTSLTTAPELPATILGEACYSGMFRGCTSLTTAPTLSATTLTGHCYITMFLGCTSLTTAPELPATILAEWCYSMMFYGCTSLTTAPELPATTLVSNCYNGMFEYCSRLNNIKCLATDLSATDCLYAWVGDISASGTFTKAAGTTWPAGTDGIPTGWTVVEV